MSCGRQLKKYLFLRRRGWVKTLRMIEQQMLSKSTVKLKMRVKHRSIVSKQWWTLELRQWTQILRSKSKLVQQHKQMNLNTYSRRQLSSLLQKSTLLRMKTGCGFTLVSGADPGEVKWVNFHPPFFWAPFFLFSLIPQILIDSVTLLQKFTPHFKILDLRLVWQWSIVLLGRQPS